MKALIWLGYHRTGAANGKSPISNKIRKDNDFRFNGTVAVPLDSGWSVFTTLGWQDHQSNLPNNEFENFSATLGANVRF